MNQDERLTQTVIKQFQKETINVRIFVCNAVTWTSTSTTRYSLARGSLAADITSNASCRSQAASWASSYSTSTASCALTEWSKWSPCSLNYQKRGRGLSDGVYCVILVRYTCVHIDFLSYIFTITIPISSVYLLPERRLSGASGNLEMYAPGISVI